MSDIDETTAANPRDAAARRSDPPPEAAAGAPVFAADGTDLTVIRWMLGLSPEDRLRWLQSHMSAVAAIRRDQREP